MSQSEIKYHQLHMKDTVDRIPFNRYPRPQMIRNTKWINLNGKWDCGVTVPFPLQSELSGYKGKVADEYTYFTTFDYHAEWINRVLLHFGAVDQICEVSVDGHPVGIHKGGYLPFTFDITDALDNTEIHKLKVHITDTLSHEYPYGKQSKKRGGMWYTPVSGIWQTVWIEEVPTGYIRGYKVTPTTDGISLLIDGDDEEYNIEVIQPTMSGSLDMSDGSVICKEHIYGNKSHIEIENPHLWSPDTPWLYGIKIYSQNDMITGYFALRTIKIKKVGSQKRILLNDKPIFLSGVLDQGYYPEGIFLPNSERGYEEDILAMKELGFNTLRKHIKIEPACFYNACDRLGMLVMQDMVNNSDYDFMRDTVFPTAGIKYKPDLMYHRDARERSFFENHMKDTAKYLYNFPCVVYYTIFNEGWGQFQADKMYEELKSVDDSRVIDATSGWFKQLKSDVESKHVYFHRVSQTRHRRPIIISEFGGYSYVEKDHVYSTGTSYGYKSYVNKEALNEGLEELYSRDVIPYIEKGLCGSVYTQLSDVEEEINGFYTYDRRICKIDKHMMQRINIKIYKTYNEKVRQNE